MNRRTLLLGAALRPARRASCARRKPTGRIGRSASSCRSRPGSFTDVAARLLAHRTDRTARPAGHRREPRRRPAARPAPQAVARAEPDGYTLLLSDIVAVDLARDLSQAALRSAARSRLHQPHRGLAGAPDGAARPRAYARSPNWSRSAKQKPGEIDVRLGRPGLVGAPGDGAVPRRRRHQGAARAVPRHRGGDRRDDRRPRRHGDRQPRLRPRAGAGRHPARPRHHRATSAARCCRTCRPSPRPASRASTCRTGSRSPRPPHTPQPIIERLNREVVRACAQPRLREAFAQAGRARRHLDAGGDDAPSRTRDRRLARRRRAREHHDPVIAGRRR